MYRPDAFRVDDVAQVHALMRARPFAILVSGGPSGLAATHLPTILKDDGPFGTIECHVARASPHWEQLAAGDEALVIFNGPQTYITPNWYPSKSENGKVVPTWNYAIAHAYGRPEVVHDPAWLRGHVGELTDRQEAGAAKPWSVSDAPDRYVETMLRGIVGIRIRLSRLEGKWKVSQNRDQRDRSGVVAGLGHRSQGDDSEIAGLVARLPGA